DPPLAGDRNPGSLAAPVHEPTKEYLRTPERPTAPSDLGTGNSNGTSRNRPPRSASETRGRTGASGCGRATCGRGAGTTDERASGADRATRGIATTRGRAT